MNHIKHITIISLGLLIWLLLWAYAPPKTTAYNTADMVSGYIVIASQGDYIFPVASGEHFIMTYIVAISSIPGTHEINIEDDGTIVYRNDIEEQLTELVISRGDMTIHNDSNIELEVSYGGYFITENSVIKIQNRADIYHIITGFFETQDSNIIISMITLWVMTIGLLWLTVTHGFKAGYLLSIHFLGEKSK